MKLRTNSTNYFDDEAMQPASVLAFVIKIECVLCFEDTITKATEEV